MRDDGAHAPVAGRLFRPVALIGIALVVVSAFDAGRGGVRDLVTGGPAADVSLVPIDAAWMTATEPVLGPVVRLVSRLTLVELVALVLWIPALAFVIRRLRRRRPWTRRGLIADAAFAFGGAVPIAIALLPLDWVFGLSSSTTRAAMVAVPCVVLALLVAHRLRGGARLLPAVGAVFVPFVGVLGFVVIVLAIAMLLVPGAFRAGEAIAVDDDHYVIDFHAHSSTRKDAWVGAPARAEIFREHGFDLTVASEHNYVVARRRGEGDYRQVNAAARAAGSSLLALPAQEFTTHSFHAILLGVRKRFAPGHYRIRRPGARTSPPDYGYDIPRLIRDVHADGGRVIVAHWWMLYTWHRIDWRRLVALGVDGFEIASGSDWAPPALIDAWRRAGMLLVGGTDFHGLRKSIHVFNLVPKAIANPDGLPLDDLDPYAVADRIAAAGNAIRPIAALEDRRAITPWLAPPVAVWHYFAALRPASRGAWILTLGGALALLGVLRRPARLRLRREAEGAYGSTRLTS